MWFRLNSRYAGSLDCLFKKKLHCHNVNFLYKGNCEGSQKVKMRMWRVVQEFTHIHVQKVKQPFCCTDVH